MPKLLIDISDDTYNYFKKFKLTNIGDGKHIDKITFI